MKSLLLTLGHNSSAIMVEDGKIKWGYETERISRQKSDSHFPEAVLSTMDVKQVDEVYVTHWSPDGRLSSMSAKHWHPARFENTPIRTLSVGLSHHDTHMHGAMCYAGNNFPYSAGTYGLVVDGFGTLGENLSVYNLTSGKPILKQRVHGYGTSMGLWYQYATAFMSMKMHEDEYKILGYEAHVPEDLVAELNAAADVRASYILDQMHKSVYGSAYDPMYSLEALANIKNEIFTHLYNICAQFSVTDPSSQSGRIIIGYYVQAVLESVILTVVRSLNARNLILSGGVFYNVKLNKRIIDECEGLVCVYPLAGDQGNAIGLYYLDHPEFEFPSNLNWGHRTLRDPGNIPNMIFARSEEEAGMLIHRELAQGIGYINLVRGNMEFGPRAMCNTSTIAAPTRRCVQAINAANNRNTFMPMAPVMTRECYRQLFENTDKVWKSEAHMIVGLEYRETPMTHHLGIAHEYNVPHHHFTGRPQVVRSDDLLMDMLCTVHGPLINTSFNFHGQPIALGMASIVDNHMMQYKRDPTIKTIVVQHD
jgi:carbamoyltransferase